MKASLSNHRQSVRKTKLIADLVRGKSVVDARTILSFTDKKAAEAFKKLIESAVANARVQGVDESALFVKEIKVDQGVAIRRFMPMARGSAHPFRRGASHISVVLGSKEAAKKASSKKVAKKRAVTKATT